MGRIFITSDFHFGHNQPFIYEKRGFKNISEMNTEMIKRYNSVVKYDDEVYVLGDCMLGDNVIGCNCLSQLQGNLHIIRGNHCTDTRMELYRTGWNVVEVCEGKFLHYNGYHFYLSHFPTLTSNMDSDKPLKKRTLSLCGHSHVTDPFADWDKGPIYHVEVDCHNCYPVLIDDIITTMEKKMEEKK